MLEEYNHSMGLKSLADCHLPVLRSNSRYHPKEFVDIFVFTDSGQKLEAGGSSAK